MMTKKLLSIINGIYQSAIPFIYKDIDGIWSTKLPKNLLILSGSFNPFHDGHLGMMKKVKDITKLLPVYEISVLNVDKPSISLNDLFDRLDAFPNKSRVLITASPRFNEKSVLFPDSKFLIGYDTALRLLHSKYYSDFIDKNNNNIVLNALDVIRENKCSFIVAGRIDKGGKFKSIDDLEIHPSYKQLFSGIPEKSFRLDISSTEIRGNVN